MADSPLNRRRSHFTETRALNTHLVGSGASVKLGSRSTSS